MEAALARALVVEDDRSWQQILREILEDAGLVVDIADNLELALQLLSAEPHRLVVVDLSLTERDHSNQDGLQVLESARRLDPGCITMLLTGFATVELAVSALTEYGAFTCLRKEIFQRSQFREMIDRALTSAPSPENIGNIPAVQMPSERRAPSGAISDSAVNLALVVEDDAGWRSILFELLSDAGYRVRLCSSFGEAFGCLRREKYQIAVVDLSLSGAASQKYAPWISSRANQDLEGYRLLTSTRAGGIPTIVVSGVGNPADIERAYQEQGIFAYMEKQTFGRRAFLNTVREASNVNQAASELEVLTGREREVLNLLAQGLTNKEIAEALVISTNTVKRHLKAIFAKLDIHTRSAAAAKAKG